MLPRDYGTRPSAALGLLRVLCCCCFLYFSVVLAESLTQLPAPRNQRIHLYNLEEILSWDPVPISSLTSPVLYTVEYKFMSSNNWKQLECVHCTKIAEPICNITTVSSPECFPPYFNVSLRVKAELGELVSDWSLVPWFQHFRNATIGPPLNVLVTSHDGSLIISFKPPFKVQFDKFHYYVYYWEKEGKQEVKGPFISQPIQLEGLKVPSEYCLQVQAELIPRYLESRHGLLSNISCHETSSEASTKLQQTIKIIIILVVLPLILLVLGYFLAKIFQKLIPIKDYLHPPPRIPDQIKEFLRDPNEPILETLDKYRSVEEDCWDSLSIVSCTRNQAVPSSNLSDNTCTDNQRSTKMT